MSNIRVLICCAILCAGGWAHGEPVPPNSSQEFTSRVIAVLDGDTVLVRRNVKLVKIRLAEIDAPEKMQAFGLTSRKSLSGMVLHKSKWTASASTKKWYDAPWHGSIPITTATAAISRCSSKHDGLV